jgi:flagellin-like hook-associated protein FlgL
MVSLFTDRASLTALKTLSNVKADGNAIRQELSSGLAVASAKDNAAFFLVANTTRSDITIQTGIRENLTLALNAVKTGLAGIEAIGRSVDQIRSALIVAQAGGDASALGLAVDEQLKLIKDTIRTASFAGMNLLQSGTSRTIVSGLDRGAAGFSFDTLALESAALDARPLDSELNAEGFLEEDGLLVFEAENYYIANAGDGHSWGSSAYGGFVHVADESNGHDAWMTEAQVENNAPELRYRATLTTPGTYYVWVRGVAEANPRGNSDSIHIGLNGQRLTQDGGLTGFGSSPSWGRRDTYTGNAVSFTVTGPGTYDVNIWAREDGVSVDKIILTQDAGYVPTGTGPAENQFVTPGADYLMDPAFGQERRETAGFIELIERVRPEEASVNFRTALTLLDAAESKLRRAASKLGGLEGRIVRQQEYLQDLNQGLEQSVGALVDSELDELSGRLAANQIAEALATQALASANDRKRIVLDLFN